MKKKLILNMTPTSKSLLLSVSLSLKKIFEMISILSLFWQFSSYWLVQPNSSNPVHAVFDCLEDFIDQQAIEDDKYFMVFPYQLSKYSALGAYLQSSTM